MFSLRFKLTFYYLAILALILIGVGIASNIYLTRTLLSTIDDSLFEQVERIDHHLAVAAGLRSDEEVDRHEYLVDMTPHLTQIIDSRGRVADEVLGDPRYDVPVDPLSLQRIAVGETVFTTASISQQQMIRLATRRVLTENRDDHFFIRSGQSLETIDLAQDRLFVLMAVAIPIALLLGGMGGLVIANQALYQVDRIRQTAEQINAGDLTERVPLPARMDEIGRLASTFNQMIARLQAAFDRQKQFTSDASHEMRTPLAVMRGDIEITLRRERTVPEYQSVLGSTLEEIVRLTRLVEDLLLLTRADIGKIELQCRPVNLTRLCRDLVDYIAPLARHQAQELILRLPEDDDLVVNADENRLRQLLLNLIDNAIKYTDPGGMIELSVSAEDGWFVLRVRDNGRGISPEDLPRIFDRFFRRSKMGNEPNVSGSGLGLSISKWIVDSHDGKIDVRSSLGGGTEFTVRLP
jgi:two-component system, OmpR family, sensor kinase